MVKSDVVVEGPVEKVTCKEIVEAMQKMKSGKATEPLEVSVKMIVASGKIGVKRMRELCQRVLDGREMPYEWKTNMIEPISLLDIMSCVTCREVKLLEHAMKIVDKVPKRRIRTLISLDLGQEKKLGMQYLL